MDPPLVAASASGAADLGVQLAQDLYRLASEYPSVECQIGRIAQAFVDLNLTLADLASALPPAAGSPVSLSPSCMGRIVALIDRIHGVQKTFFEGLNEDASPNGKKQSTAAAAKKSTTKLGRLKALFPGSGADERFTEMEWMRNTLALLAAVLRLAVAQAEADSTNGTGLVNQTRFRIASETLTSAVIIYVRTIEQRLADPEDDDQSDDEEPITGPGSLLYVAPVPPPPPKETKKGKSKVKKAPVEPKVDAADWIYQNLRDRIKENDRAEDLSSQFVEWLLEESVVIKPVEKSESAETTDDKLTEDIASKDTDAVVAAPEPEPPVFLSKKALKKLAKNKGKAKAVVTPMAEPELGPEKLDDNVETTTAEDDDIALLEKAIADAQAAIASSAEEKEKAESGADAAPEAPPTDQSGTPKATAAAQTEPSKSKDAKFGRHDLEQDHEDLPPPYPSPDAFMPQGGRGAPFGPSHFPYPGANPMAYQTAPGAPFDMPPYMQPQAAMFHGVGFYPGHMPYMAAASQPFYGPRGAAAGDAYGTTDPYDSHAPARPFPGMRRGSIERSYRDAPGRDSGRGGALVSRRRAGTYGGKYDEEEHFDDDIPANRRRGLTGRRRRDTDESQDTNDDKENDQDGPSNKPGDNAEREKDDAPPTEMSLERVPYRPKKSTKKAAADDEEKRHYSDAETIDIRDAVPIASNSGKKRNAKAVTPAGKKAGQSSKESSPPSASVLPTPPTPPSAAGEDEDVVEASTSKSKKSKAKSKGKNTGKAKAKEIEEHHSDTEPETKGKDDSEYESANEGNNDKSDDDSHDQDDEHDDHDHEDETQFSPDTEHRVFTPPPTPPHVPHPGEAPVPPPAAHMHPPAPHLGGPPGAAAAPGGLPGMPPYFGQPRHPSMMGAHPYQAQRRGGPEVAASYGPNVDIGMGPAGAGIEQLWASFLSERMGMPPPATPWAAAGAAATAGMDGPRDGPPAAKGMSSNWIRGEDHAMPVRGPPPQASGAPPPPLRSQQPQQWNRYRSRMHEDDHDHRGPVYEHSEDEDYDDYGHHDRRDRNDRHDPRDHRDRRDDYDGRGPARRDSYHAADYPPRRRSRSPPYHAQDRRRDYHEQQRQQRPRYHPDDSPPRGWERDERDDRHDFRGDLRGSPPNHHHGGGQHHQQQTPQQQYRNPYHAYYDQPRRPSFSTGAAPAPAPVPAPAPAPAEWGWPGDVKQPPHHHQQSQMPPAQQMPPHMPQMQMPLMPQMTPQMPPMFPQAPPQHGGGHPPPTHWEDGWNEVYRQGRGHAEFAMTEIDG